MLRIIQEKGPNLGVRIKLKINQISQDKRSIKRKLGLHQQSSVQRIIKVPQLLVLGLHLLLTYLTLKHKKFKRIIKFKKCSPNPSNHIMVREVSQEKDLHHSIHMQVKCT